MKIFLVRHGETEGNLKSHISGSLQDCLTLAGQERSLALKPVLDEFLKENKFKTITTSAKRAQETAKILLPSQRGPKINDSFLEINAGSYSNKTWNEFFKIKERTSLLSEICFLQGESYRDLYARVCQGLDDEIVSCKGQDLVFVIHGGAIGCILHYLLEIDFCYFPKFTISNSSLTILTKTNESSFKAELINFTPNPRFYPL